MRIEAYLESLSASPGETIRLHASAEARWCALQIVREGLHETCVHVDERLEIGNHPLPSKPWETGAQWPVCWEFKIPRAWRSGVYRIDLFCGDISEAFHWQGWSQVQARHSILLVVRADSPGRAGKILLQLTTNTYRAYNTWGGASLYGSMEWTRNSARSPARTHLGQA